MKNRFEIIDNTIVIYINSKYGSIKTIVDIEDFELVNEYKNSWCINYKNGRIDGVRTKVQSDGIRRQIWLHRVVTKCPENKVVDHINGNTLDNRKNNLRIVTQEQNATNLSSSSNSKSKYRNIYFEKGKYAVRINNKRLGRYKKLEDAVNCRNKNIAKVFPLRTRKD